MGLPPAKRLAKLHERTDFIGYVGELLSCNLCTGLWVYFVVCTFYRVTFGPYVPLVSELATAAIMSFVMHLIFLGAKLRWGTFEE